MSGITTHVLDTSRGRPAEGMAVVLERAVGSDWEPVGRGTTDADGRVTELLTSSPLSGRYRLTFDTGARSAFYP